MRRKKNLKKKKTKQQQKIERRNKTHGMSCVFWCVKIVQEKEVSGPSFEI